MNKKDLLIVSSLRRDSRESISSISRKTGIPVSTIFDKIKKKCNGWVKKNTVILDFKKIGYCSRVFLLIKCPIYNRRKLFTHLYSCYNTNNLYKISNGFDFLFEGVFKDLKQIENFIEDLEEKYEIRNIINYNIIEELKQESFLNSIDCYSTIVKEAQEEYEGNYCSME